MRTLNFSGFIWILGMKAWKECSKEYVHSSDHLDKVTVTVFFWGGMSIGWFSGGTFFLESQAFCTYRKKKKLTEKIFHNFKVISWQESCDATNIIDNTFFLQNIKLKPENFTDFLIHEVRNVLPAQLFLFTINCFLQVGFSRSEVLALPAHPAKGFQRPLQVILFP